MSEVRIFGRNSDGTVGSICRAKPENRGKGNCKHQDHIELTLDDLRDGMIEKINAKMKHQDLLPNGLSKNSSELPEVTADKIQAQKNGFYISKQELDAAANESAKTFTQSDWKFIKEFSDKYDELSVDDREEFDRVINNLETFLSSDSTTSRKIRDFLGDEIDLKEFSTLVVQGSGAMTKSVRWGRGGRNSVKRVFFTNIHNDMTKERYVASVLFFGGRCCYCNAAMSKHGKNRATGEHITPISPEKSDDISGGTRFGNMALACNGCNRQRGNKELVSWIQKTNRIPRTEKGKALGRIRAFREYALYEDYSDADSAKINEAVDEVNKEIAKRKNPDGSFKDQESVDEIKVLIKTKIYDLKLELESSR